MIEASGSRRSYTSGNAVELIGGVDLPSRSNPLPAYPSANWSALIIQRRTNSSKERAVLSQKHLTSAQRHPWAGDSQWLIIGDKKRRNKV